MVASVTRSGRYGHRLAYRRCDLLRVRRECPLHTATPLRADPSSSENGGAAGGGISNQLLKLLAIETGQAASRYCLDGDEICSSQENWNLTKELARTELLYEVVVLLAHTDHALIFPRLHSASNRRLCWRVEHGNLSRTAPGCALMELLKRVDAAAWTVF
jgi:hypothetical protein